MKCSIAINTCRRKSIYQSELIEFNKNKLLWSNSLGNTKLNQIKQLILFKVV